MSNYVRSISLVALATAALAGCGESLGVGGPHSVAVSFQVVGSGVASLGGGPAQVVGPPLQVVGTNGTLTIDEIRVIVAEIELEGEGGMCSADDHSGPDSSSPAASGDSSGPGGGDDGSDNSGPGGGDDGSDNSGPGGGDDDTIDDHDEDCEEFEGAPRFIDLPLDGSPVEVATTDVPAGTYDEIEFEVEDLQDDEGDAEEEALIAQVRAEVLAAFPDWPEEASVLVAGSFTATGGSSVPFRVFLEAEIEVELELDPPLVIEGGVASREVTVDIEPALWFTLPDGRVLDLTAFDFDTTGQVVEFEAGLEHGFTEIEIDHHD